MKTNHSLQKNNNYENSKNIDEAKNSPLPSRLFYFCHFIKTVYIQGNFIGLEKFDIVDGTDVKDSVPQTSW